VAALAHREKLPETTAALGRFLQQRIEAGGDWMGFEELVTTWQAAVQEAAAQEELDGDRVGVFWALLFLCSQGRVELEQQGGLFGPLRLRRPEGASRDGDDGPLTLPLPPHDGLPRQGSDGAPARAELAA
jgi:segregation and condensation protein A